MTHSAGVPGSAASSTGGEGIAGGSPAGKPGKVKPFAVRLIEKARRMKVRLVVVLLGGLAVIGGLVIWLAPVGSTSATENTTTTVIDGAGHKSTTVVKKNTASKSDTMLVALFTAGVGLLAIGALWDRIREVGFGNLSIKLTEATVEQQEIRIAAARVEQLESVDSAAPIGIANEVRNLPKDLGFARMDLERPGIMPQEKPGWAPTNLKFYVLMLANHTRVEVLIFTSRLDYLGAAPVAWLADRVARTDPALFAAYQAVDKELIVSKFDADQLGRAFYDALGPEDGKLNDPAKPGEPTRQPRHFEDQVDWGWLKEFAGAALITQCIEVDVGQSLSRQEQLEVLAFPLVFVPITNRRRRFEAVLDKRRIAQTLGFSAIDFRPSTT